jgi:peptidoglycan hydrolase-like protein with peptidoglycan-binding domain
MPQLSYRQDGLILRVGGTATAQQIKDLQRDLRRLGYLRAGVDGAFGPGTAQAVKALQHDLLTNDGSSGTHNDGTAPVAIKNFNRGVTAVTGDADQKLVESISAILDEARIPVTSRHRSCWRF